MINIPDKSNDFGAILICAVRYCIGRQAYMPELVINLTRPLLSKLNDKTLHVMARDISGADNLGDAEIDAPMWAAFLAEIEKERKRRKA